MDPAITSQNGRRDPRLANAHQNAHPKIEEKSEFDDVIQASPDPPQADFQRVFAKLEQQFQIVRAKTNGLPEKEAVEQLMAFSNVDKPSFDCCCAGLIFGFLVDPDRAERYYKLLTQVAVIDQWFVTLCHINMILIELFHKLKTPVRMQMIALFRLLIRERAPKMDNVVLNFVRFIGTDCCDLAETYQLLVSVSQLLLENVEWLKTLKTNASLPSIALLVATRYVSDSTAQPGFEQQKMFLVNFCEMLFRQKFMALSMLGRELLYILLRLGRHPKFAAIWSELFTNPLKLSPMLKGGALDIMMKPTAAFAFVSRIPLSISKRVESMIKHASGAPCDMHFEWFHRTLSNPTCVGLRAEILRILPHILVENRHSYEVRAMFATFLINTAPPSEQQVCKLAFFWDWLYYTQSVPPQPPVNTDVVLSALSHMIHSVPRLASAMIEFLVLIVSTIDPPREQRIVESTMRALKAAGPKCATLQSILEHQNFDPSVRDAFQARFPNVVKFNAPPPVDSKPEVKHISTPQSPKPSSGPQSGIPRFPSCQASTSKEPLSQKNRALPVDVVPQAPPEKIKKTKTVTDSPAEPNAASSIDDNDMEDVSDDAAPSALDTSSASSEEFDNVEQFLVALSDDNLREFIEELDNAVKKDDGNVVEIFNKLLYAICEKADLIDDEQLELIGQCLLTIFDPFFKKHHFIPKDTTEDSVREILSNTPFYALFRLLCLFSDHDRQQLPLMSLLVHMHEKQPCLSYLMLYFLKGGRIGDDRGLDIDEDSVNLYSMFCERKDVSVEAQIATDLETCEADGDHRLFVYLVPYVFDKFDTQVIGSAPVLKVVCSHVDRIQLHNLTCDILRENITMFRKDSFVPLIMSSLEWEPLDQITLWQFIHTESVPADWIFPAVPKLSSTKHCEAVSNTLLMLRRLSKDPTLGLVKQLFSKSAKDQFTVNALLILFDDDNAIPRVAAILLKVVKNLIKNGNLWISKKEQKGALSVELVFAHIENLRNAYLAKVTKKVESFFSHSDLRELFNEVKSESSLEQIPKKFSELFTMIEIMDEDRKSSRGARKARRRQATAGNTADSDDEEKVVRKKRRLKEDSDSD